MNSAIAVAIGLTLAITLILKKCHPVYALILGAVVSGLMSGWGFDLTIKEMFSGEMTEMPGWLSPNTQKVSQNHVKVLILADFFDASNIFIIFAIK